MMRSPVELLSGVPLFAGMDARDLSELTQNVVYRHLAPGATLFLEGDPASYLFVVIRGRIQVFKEDPKGRRRILLHQEEALGVVAEIAVLLQHSRYPASAEAAEESEVAAIPREHFERLIGDSPALARALIHYLARRQQALLERLERVLFYEVAARLAEYLLREVRTEEGLLLPGNAELAGTLATVPEIVSRRLGQFDRQNLIRLEGRRVRLLDPGGLQALTGQ